MNSNSNAIFTLCSHLCVGDNVVPLEPKEWGDLAKKLMEAGLQPESIFDLSKAELKEKQMALNFHNRKEERSKTNYQSFHFTKLKT